MRVRDHTKGVTIRKVTVVLAVIVVLCAAYLLTMPAFTVSRDAAQAGAGIQLETGQTNSAVSTSSQPDDGAPAQDLHQEVDLGDDHVLEVRVEAEEGALPEGVTMKVSPVTDVDVIDAARECAADEIDMPDGALRAMAVDITFRDLHGNVIQPAKPVRVSMTTPIVTRRDQLAVVHVDDDLSAETVPAGEVRPDQERVSFDAARFSVYALVYTVDFSYEVDGKVFAFSMDGGSSITIGSLLARLGIVDGDEQAREFEAGIENIGFSNPELIDVEHAGDTWTLSSLAPFSSEETLTITMDDGEVFTIKVTDAQLYKRIISASGETCEITVAYGEDAGIPDDVELRVAEIPQDSAEYAGYLEQAKDALGEAAGSVGYARFFDITIVDGNGTGVQPAEDSTVGVRIRLLDREAVSGDSQVVHFGEVPEVLEAEAEGDAVSFEASGFSVYAIVDAPEPAEAEIKTVTNLQELAEATQGTAFYLSVTQGGDTNKYFKNSLNAKSCFELSDNNALAASEWYFDPVDASKGTYRIATYVDDVMRYVKNTTGNDVGLVDSTADATVFEISQASDGTFYFKKQGEDRWLQYSGSGKGIRFWTDKKNLGNTLVTITYASSVILPSDPYDLNGRTFGIAYHDESATSAALTTEAKAVGNQQRLAGQDMLMRPDVLDNDGVLLVAENSDITEWTFESISEDKYHITTTVGGQRKYLTIDGGDVTLRDEPDEVHSVIKATPGTGANAGKWHFTVDGRSLCLPNGVANGFGAATGTGATTWMNLVERSVLADDDFHLYTARKVSVSDTERLRDGQQVVIYTRVWNDTTKRYEFFAVDHDGSLARCYDTGDGIEWIGSQVNTALWGFTEYTDGDGTPNHYYELQNVQYGDCIAPQLTDGQILSPSAIGINLNGRRQGQNYTTIIAWDDANYQYVGLKTENGRIVACPLAEAEDFYFAIVDEVDPEYPEGKLTTVDTIDSDAYGITMKMTDFNNVVNGRDSAQSSFFGGDNNKAGLLSTNLAENGYPTSTGATGTSGRSLSELFSADKMTSVNHLFLQSIHNESGYFEYDSTQNFAHLNTDGDDAGNFTVYNQLGAITGNSEHKSTREHGQFMPYDQIEDGGYAYDADGHIITNRTDVLGNELADTDARKGEKLYNLGTTATVDYFFGMEMEAGFTQTADGLDAWGHDIIFEFSGDDDFWFYVDGELVLDLGGVHSAMTGSINFRTGEVKSSRGNSTLYEIFKKNYQTRGMSEAEINAKLSESFEQRTVDGKTVHVFKDYSNHTMKMFYMERGAGASNLHMRFNLAAVQPGTFILSKKLSGTDSPSNDLIEFPYQVWYYDKEDADERNPILLDEKVGDDYSVRFEGTTIPVRYTESFTPAGGTRSYSNVFFLKPGQSASVRLPDNAARYYVVECGVNPDVYQKVSANGTKLHGDKTDDTVGTSHRYDYATDRDSLQERSRVDFDNEVKEGAVRTLSITKKLYDVDGQTLLHFDPKAGEKEDKTLFDFRLYLGDENSSADSIPAAGMCSYHVKDAQGDYCRWDADGQSFVSLGKKQLNALSEDEKAQATFHTSMNGAISKIPADHTVEVRDLIVGTKYKVEERDDEIPKGYTLRLGDGYTRVDGDNVVTNGTTPISGTIQAGEDPEIEIRNQKGWGLTVKKVWTDKDFMEAHDSTYFAVYVQNDEVANAPGTLLEGSVRQLKATEDEIYYFFSNLSSTVPFKDYIVREVTLEGDGITVNDDGEVTGYTSVIPIEDGGTLAIGGTPVGGEHSSSDYTYTVTYQPGEQTTQNENVRTDTVTNSRPGIKLYKTDWGGDALPGAVFMLKDSSGGNVAAETYTSRDPDGLITIAYLSPGTYELTEIAAPRGYMVSDAPMEIVVADDGQVKVAGVDASFYTLTQATDTEMAAIKVKDRTTALTVQKVDADGRSLSGAHFALYDQVTDNHGNKVKDYSPKPGYGDLVSDGDGVLQAVTMDSLRAGTYYLTETQAPTGCDKLTEDLCFTIGDDGTVVIEGDEGKSWLAKSDDGAGRVAYILTIPNGKMKKVEIKKVSAENHGTLLQDASFALYAAEDFDDDANTPKAGARALVQGTTSAEGILPLGELPAGEYRLVETNAPAGYNLLGTPVKVFVRSDEVAASQGGNDSTVRHLDSEGADTWQIEVWNSAGYELPSTGGPGTIMMYLVGGALMLLAGTGLIFRHLHTWRRRD